MSPKQLILDGLRRAGAFGLARRLYRDQFLGATVILFHRVLPAGAAADHYVRLMGDPTAPQLEALIAYLKRWFRFATPRECVERWRGGREVDPFTLLLTFDDGYADMYTELLPVLRRCEVPATVFVTTGAIDQQVMWFQRLFGALTRSRRPETPPFAGLAPMPLGTVAQKVAAIKAVSAAQFGFPAERWQAMISDLAGALEWDGRLGDLAMMTWEQVEALHRSGWVTVGGHSVTHPHLAQCTADQVRHELFDCATELRRRLALDFLPFSYPNGRLPPPEVLEQVRAAGYDCAFTGRWNANTSATPLFELGRQTLPPDDVSRASLTLLRRARAYQPADQNRPVPAPGEAPTPSPAAVP